MSRTTAFTSLVLFAALLGGCSASTDASQGNGVDPASDADHDNVPAAQDKCPEAAAGEWTDAQGCGESQDGDGDGVPTDQDLCPDTPAGEAVDGTGCSASQDPNAGSGGAAGASAGTGGSAGGSNATPGQDGAVAPNGFASFTLDPKGKLPVALKTLAKNVKALQNGFQIDGSLLVQLPKGQQLLLAEAHIKLEYDSAKGEGLQSVSGTCRVPFPAFGLGENASFDDLVYASIGWDLGKNIENVEAPMQDDRHYFYLTFSAGLGMNLGTAKVSVPGGTSNTIVIDPFDPYLFVKGDLLSFGGLSPIDDAGIGMSWQGLIPFTPANTWGVEQQAKPFNGHLWLEGGISLGPKIPLSISGNTVIDVDPNDDGKSVFVDPAGGIQLGANADLAVSPGYKKLPITLDIPVASATVVAKLTDQEQWAYFSGKIAPDKTGLPPVIPVSFDQSVQVAGYLNSDIEQSFLKAEGSYKINASSIEAWTGINLSDLGVAQADLTIDKNGVLVTGTATTSFAPVVGLNGNAAVEAFFGGTPTNWYVTMDGQLAVKGIDLSANAHAKLDSTGMFVSGKFQTPLSLVDMSGNITKNGVDIQGKAQVSIPIVAGKEIAQWVTDAAVCGTEAVTDAAVCGYQTVTSGAACGYKTVTSAAQCGTSYVKDGAKCGYTYAKDGAACGYTTVTSAAQCGVKVLSGWAECAGSCISGGFTNCKCEKAKTCQVAKSCNVENSCSVANTCQVAASCSVPASCQKVKTCEQKVTIPDFDYGTFVGEVTVKIGNSGLYGDVSGQYCTTNNSCTTIASGSIDMTSGTPKACVTVPGLGDFCGQF